MSMSSGFLEKITPGPWERRVGRRGDGTAGSQHEQIVGADNVAVMMLEHDGSREGRNNAAFIVLARRWVAELEKAVQDAADCLTSGLGMVTSQAYAARADGALRVLIEAGARAEHAPPVYNPHDALVVRIQELKKENERLELELENLDHVCRFGGDDG